MKNSMEELPVIIGQAGPHDGQRWTIKEGIVIGRDADSDIMVADRKVSRKHARFYSTPDGVFIEDLGSKNGTHLNSKRIDEPVLLQDGDIVQVALAQQFVYLSSDATLPLEFDHPEEIASRKERLRLDKRTRQVWIGGTEVNPPLSVAQFIMLEILYQRGGRVVSREELVDGIWGEEEAYEVSHQALDALVRRLRDRLKAVDAESHFIVTVRGHGLRLENPPE
ncbi:MAG: FHA domain-containing protein [Chloroflexi bacterium]|nr:FHA domain-containing protein [Chloroflexota bacterium]